MVVHGFLRAWSGRRPGRPIVFMSILCWDTSAGDMCPADTLQAGHRSSPRGPLRLEARQNSRVATVFGLRLVRREAANVP